MKQVLQYGLILSCLFAITSNFLKAQDNKNRLDSLQTLVTENQNPVSQLPFLLDLSKEYLWHDYEESARVYAKKGLDQASVLSDSLWIAKFSNHLSKIFYQSDDFEKAKDFSEKALSILQRSKQDQSSELAKSLFLLGNALVFLGDSSRAENSFLKSIAISEQNGDKFQLAEAYSYLAYQYVYHENFDQALKFYNISQELLRGRDDLYSILILAENANMIGAIYYFTEEIFKAMVAYQESFEFHSKIENKEGIAYTLNNIGLIYQDVEYFEKAKELHFQALQIRKEIGDSLEIAYSFFDIGELYKNQGQSENALQTYLEGLKICEAVKDKSFIDYFLVAISDLYIDKGDLAMAQKYLEKSVKPIPELKLVSAKLLLLEKKWKAAIPILLEVYNSSDQKDLIKLKSRSTDYLIEAYEALGQYKKALEFSHAKLDLTESFNNSKNTKLTRRLAFEFDSERNEAKLTSLEKASKLKQSQLENQRYLIFIIILLGLISILAALGFFFLSQRNKQLASKEAQLRASALNLFANISHEFRTPLSIIRIPLEQLQKGQFKGDIAQTRTMILAKVQRLSDLADQILNIVRIKENQFNLHLKYEDPLDFLRTFVGQFGPYANYKNLVLTLKIPTFSLFIHYDEEVWSKILNNLISNALKFTEKGQVRIEFRYRPKEIELKIIDTGRGIASEHLPHVFNRYYRSPIEKHQSLTGGLGLSLVKELVDLYKGTIDVESELNKGTTFTVRLPQKEHFKREEIPNEFNILNLSQITQKSNLPFATQIPLTLATKSAYAQPENEDPKKVLIIEDNVELNGLISNYLSNRFHVYQAYDGVEGFEVAQSMVPDLILTDVMMPGMDGIDLAQKLHTSSKTSHIPLIVISALQNEFLDDSLWKAGVVDFIQKPLNMEQLSFKINNLIANRDQFRTMIQKSGWIEVSTNVPVVDQDKAFLEKLQNVLQENMEVEGLDVNTLSKIMLVSRVQLFRKVKSLTGMTPGKLIQKIKMNYAYELLKNKKMDNVTEVATRVGYSNLSFFSRKFKEIHGVNATDIIKIKQNTNI